MDASKVNEICILSISERGAIRRYNFFIHDPEKIDIFLRCMREATPITDDPRLDRPMRSIAFRTQKAIYRISIGWNNELVYGNWTSPTYSSGGWESAELREYFKQWNLDEEIAAADPNWPPPEWMTNPPKIEPMPPFPEQESKNE